MLAAGAGAPANRLRDCEQECARLSLITHPEGETESRAESVELSAQEMRSQDTRKSGMVVIAAEVLASLATAICVARDQR
jgi:hypothetical protein